MRYVSGELISTISPSTATRAETPAKLDATLVRDVAIGELVALDCVVAAERCHQTGGNQSRPRSTAHHDHMQAAPTVLGTAPDRRKL
jgi:hypothetical protein